MELVAASKMRKAVASALAARAYAHASLEVLSSLTEKESEHSQEVPLLQKRTSGKTLVILITSNRGLCGAYNARVIKHALGMITANGSKQLVFICIGKKGHQALARVGANIIASFEDFPENITAAHATQVGELVIETYTQNDIQNVVSIYTDYESPLAQHAKIQHLLPVDTHTLEDTVESLAPEAETSPDEMPSKTTQYIFEPSPLAVLAHLIERLTHMMIFHHLLESGASEHSARMIAMKNAKEAAGDMMQELTLAFNKARQAGITQEISEISAGALSMST